MTTWNLQPIFAAWMALWPLALHAQTAHPASAEPTSVVPLRDAQLLAERAMGRKPFRVYWAELWRIQGQEVWHFIFDERALPRKKAVRVTVDANRQVKVHPARARMSDQDRPSQGDVLFYKKVSPLLTWMPFEEEVLTALGRTFRLDLRGWSEDRTEPPVMVFEDPPATVIPYNGAWTIEAERDLPGITGRATLVVNVEPTWSPWKLSDELEWPFEYQRQESSVIPIPMGGRAGLLRVTRISLTLGRGQKPQTEWQVTVTQEGAGWRLILTLTGAGHSPDPLVAEAKRLALSLRRMAGMPTRD